MKILAVLYCYPPLLVPAAMCYLKLVTGLVDQGAEVEILTIYPDSFASPDVIPLDETIESVLPPGVRNHQVWSPETSAKIRWIKRLDPKRRFTWRWLEPAKREWVNPAVEYLERLDPESYDLLLTCSQPHCNHLIGLEWKKRTERPWVAYFSDPWTDNPYMNFSSPRVQDWHRGMEDEVHAKADLVLFTCEEMLNLVQSRHSALDQERTGVLPHAFVPAWYGEEQPQRLPGAPIQLLHTGTFYGPRSPQPLIDSLWRIDQHQPLLGKLRVDSYGGMEERHQKSIKTRNLEGIFEVHGFVAYLESLHLMKACDALLLIDAALTSTEESVFLPSKLVDYLGAGRPVIAVTPRQGATARVVEQAGGLVVPIEEPEALDQVLLEILERGSVIHDPRPEYIEEFEHSRVAAMTIERFASLRR